MLLAYQSIILFVKHALDIDMGYPRSWGSPMKEEGAAPHTRKDPSSAGYQEVHRCSRIRSRYKEVVLTHWDLGFGAKKYKYIKIIDVLGMICTK